MTEKVVAIITARGGRCRNLFFILVVLCYTFIHSMSLRFMILLW